MKILIAYASKNGSTADCAKRLANLMHHADVTLVNLETESPEPDLYDVVVFGSSVRFGKLLPPATRFLKEHHDTLLQKKLALFLCCGYAHEYEYYLEKLFPKDVLEHSVQTLYFGGTLKKDGLPFFDKMVVRSMRASIFENDIDNGEYTPTLPSILPENIDKMATHIRGCLKS